MLNLLVSKSKGLFGKGVHVITVTSEGQRSYV